MAKAKSRGGLLNKKSPMPGSAANIGKSLAKSKSRGAGVRPGSKGRGGGGGSGNG